MPLPSRLKIILISRLRATTSALPIPTCCGRILARLCAASQPDSCRAHPAEASEALALEHPAQALAVPAVAPAVPVPVLPDWLSPLSESDRHCIPTIRF